MTNDESSCDVTDGDVEHQNGILGKGSSLESTEEESSNESILVNSNPALEDRKITAKNPPLPTDYLNGNSSLDSLESTPLSALQNGKRKSNALVTTDKDSEPQGPPSIELVNCHDSTSQRSDEAPQPILAAGQHNKQDEMEIEDEPEGKVVSSSLFTKSILSSCHELHSRYTDGVCINHFVLPFSVVATAKFPMRLGMGSTCNVLLWCGQVRSRD